MASDIGLVVAVIVVALAVIGTLYYFLVLQKKQKKPLSQQQMPQAATAPSLPKVAPHPRPVQQHQPEVTQITIPEHTKQEIQANAPFDVNKKISHEEQMAEFYRNLPTFGKDVEKIVAALHGIDYVRLDKGKLKDRLEHVSGMNFEEAEAVLHRLETQFEKKKTIENLKKEYPHYKNMGMVEEEIRLHFKKEGYDEEVIKEASRQYHQENLYNSYIDQLIKHMKPFLLAGESDEEVKKSFIEHHWPEALVLEALEETKIDLEKEHSARYLQELILSQLLEGESKSKVIKALTKQGWPDDELKKEYADVDEGLQHLETALELVDINDYNLNKVKEALKAKNWPDEVIDRTVKKLVDDITYHRKLNRLKQEVDQLVAQGYNATQIRFHLESQSWDHLIINKMIHRINAQLSKQGDKEKIKQFNDHVFKQDAWHQHMHEVTNQFAVPKAPPQQPASPQSQASASQQQPVQNSRHDANDLLQK